MCISTDSPKRQNDSIDLTLVINEKQFGSDNIPFGL